MSFLSENGGYLFILPSGEKIKYNYKKIFFLNNKIAL